MCVYIIDDFNKQIGAIACVSAWDHQANQLMLTEYANILTQNRFHSRNQILDNYYCWVKNDDYYQIPDEMKIIWKKYMLHHNDSCKYFFCIKIDPLSEMASRMPFALTFFPFQAICIIHPVLFDCDVNKIYPLTIHQLSHLYVIFYTEHHLADKCDLVMQSMTCTLHAPTHPHGLQYTSAHTVFY